MAEQVFVPSIPNCDGDGDGDVDVLSVILSSFVFIFFSNISIGQRLLTESNFDYYMTLTCREHHLNLLLIGLCNKLHLSGVL